MMELKTYQGRSMTDALAQVKNALGNEAVILHTRTLKRGGVLGLGAKAIVEITARADSSATPSQPAASPKVAAGAPAGRGTPENAVFRTVRPNSARGAIDRKSLRERPAPPIITDEPPTAMHVESRRVVDLSMLREIQEIRAMVQGLLAERQTPGIPNLPGELLSHYTRLIQQEVAAELVQDICRQVEIKLGLSSRSREKNADSERPSREEIDAALLESLASMLPIAEPLSLTAVGRPTVVALVGPTGVGKTTTLAKLAANMKLREKKKVGLITIDAYRIAAVEQLKTYAQIMKVPLQAVTQPEEITAAINHMRDLDLILIDTAGRSQRDESRIAELQKFLELARPDQVHLVLSGTSRQAEMCETIANFSAVGATHVILTKLDEAIGFGVILNALQGISLRLSYVTHGQSVPADIQPGQGRRLARLILGQTGEGKECQ